MGIAFDHDETPDPTADGGTYRIAGMVARSGEPLGTYVPLDDDGEETVVPEALLAGLSDVDVDVMMLDLQGTTIMLHPDEPSLDAPVSMRPPMRTASFAASPVPARTTSPQQRPSRNRANSLPPTNMPLPSEASDDDLLDLSNLKTTPSRPLFPPRVESDLEPSEISVPSEPTVFAAALAMPAPSEPTPRPQPERAPAPETRSTASAPSAWSVLTGFFRSVFPA